MPYQKHKTNHAEKESQTIDSDNEAHPFNTSEEVWFWFITAQQARNEGARFTAGISNRPRPCEPIDILKIVDRLYRTRRLIRDHLLVLRHYGRRQMPPDSRRPKEYIASKLWKEAMNRIEEPLIEKKILQEKTVFETMIDSTVMQDRSNQYRKTLA